MGKTAEAVPTGTREYLTFRLDQEEYGIDILKVQEIRGYEPPTRIANAPNFIKGVVNLRGTIVPIVDMRLKFNCAQADYNSFTVVIILNLRSEVGERMLILLDIEKLMSGVDMGLVTANE
jgi:purine-binding chemotaxis protein CheW